MDNRKRISKEIRDQAVAAYVSKSMTAEEIATKYSISKQNIYRWVAEAGHKPHNQRLRNNVDHEEERIHSIEAYLKSGLSQKDFSKTWGISEVTLNRWYSLYKQHGAKGLTGELFYESHNKHNKKRGPKGISRELKKKITETKIENPLFGLKKVKNFLHRFNGLKVSTGTIRKTLKEENIPPVEVVRKKRRSSDKIRRFERARPMQLWQTDITSFVLTRHSQRVYLTVFMDDCSRYIVAWSLQQRQTSEFVIEALLNGVQKFGKPEEVLTDQGRQYFAWRGTSEFKKILDREGIKHVVARSHHPQTVGKCERFWETIGLEFWDRVKPQELSEARERIEKYINHYNHFRPHQGLDGMVPADRFFGVESEVRKALEETIQKNSLRLALDEAPRNPIFLIGQIGDQAVSLHGESGRLVVQTPEGNVKEIDYESFGSQERRDGNSKSGDNKEKTWTQEKLRDQDARPSSFAGENSLETSERRGEEESTRNWNSGDGSVDGQDYKSGSGEEIEHSTAQNLATITTSSLGNVSRITDSTEDEDERSINEERRRYQDIEEENCGIGEYNRDSESSDCNSSNDARVLASESTEGEAGCRKEDTIQESGRPSDRSSGKNENEEK